MRPTDDHDTREAGVQRAPAQVPTGPGRRGRTLVIAACAVVLGVALFLIVRSRSGAAKGASDDRDVPRLDGQSIVFSPAFEKRAGIKRTDVIRAPLMPIVQVVGTVTFDAEHVAAAGTRIRGFVRKVLKVEGDVVKKGDALAEIESAELGSAQAEVAAVWAKKKAAERNAKREAALLANNLTTAREEEIARSELEEQTAMLLAASQKVAAFGGAASGNAVGTYLVRAPIEGSVVKRYIDAAQSVHSDLIAFRVANLDYLWVELSVFEHEIGSIRVNDLAEIIPSTDTQTKIDGKISHVGDVIDPDTRTTAVRIKLDNGKRLLRPGQSVVARIRPSKLSREVLSVPLSAITYVDGKPTVFVADGDTRVRIVAVKIGRTDGERQEILEGLADKQQVISEGVFALKSELFR